MRATLSAGGSRGSGGDQRRPGRRAALGPDPARGRIPEEARALHSGMAGDEGATQTEISEKREQLSPMGAANRQDATEQARADYARSSAKRSLEEPSCASWRADAWPQNGRCSNTPTRPPTSRPQAAAGRAGRAPVRNEVTSRVQTSQESNVRVVDRAIVLRRPSFSHPPGRHVAVDDRRPAARHRDDFPARVPRPLGQGSRGARGPARPADPGGDPDIDDKSRAGGMRIRYGKSYSYQYGYGYGYGYGRAAGEAGRQGELDRRGEAAVERQIELLPHHSPRLAVSEAYRSLRTALLLSTAGELHIVALTSAEPGEGKTATTTNLGVVMAQLGRRVLLIDADLRRPRLHKVFRISNRTGLVTFLTAHVGRQLALHRDQRAQPVGLPVGSDPAQSVRAAGFGPDGRVPRPGARPFRLRADRHPAHPAGGRRGDRRHPGRRGDRLRPRRRGHPRGRQVLPRQAGLRRPAGARLGLQPLPHRARAGPTRSTATTACTKKRTRAAPPVPPSWP